MINNKFKSEGQIFIGGTGRSGTTILSKVLGLHKKIYRLKDESRFIIDPGGIIDLVPALSDDWSPYNGSNKIHEFQKIMSNLGKKETFLKKIERKLLSDLFKTSPKKYMKVPLGEIIGGEYSSILKEFYTELIDSQFEGIWVGSNSYKIKSKIISPRRYSRKEMIKLSSQLIDDLFSQPMEKNKKSYWLDHTPFNILHTKFLLELFPKAKIIHIYRDIRDVISSYKTKNWGGNSAEDIILWQKNILEKWLELKKEINESNYYELKMEDLTRNPEKELKRITDFIGIDFDKNMLDIDLTKGHSGRWKDDLTDYEILKIKNELSNVMKKYNYEW